MSVTGHHGHVRPNVNGHMMHDERAGQDEIDIPWLHSLTAWASR